MATTDAGRRFGNRSCTESKRFRSAVSHCTTADTKFSSRTLRRIAALRSGYYTRIGAALRHASRLLAQRPERHRLLLLLSDGKPNDLDHYEGRYGIEDTRQAILEARRQGLKLFGITIDREAKDYFPYLFGRGGYAIINRPERLIEIVPAVDRLTTGLLQSYGFAMAGRWFALPTGIRKDKFQLYFLKYE